MKKYDLRSIGTTQAELGKVRPRLYTMSEAAEELGVSVMRVSRDCKKHGVKPAFPVRPYKYPLNEIKDALNKESEEPLYIIEKAIPIPTRRPKEELIVTVENTLVLMKVGDSMLIPDDQQILFRRAAVNKGVKIATRKVPDSDTRRLWKVGS